MDGLFDNFKDIAEKLKLPVEKLQKHKGLISKLMSKSAIGQQAKMQRLAPAETRFTPPPEFPVLARAAIEKQIEIQEKPPEIPWKTVAAIGLPATVVVGFLFLARN